MTKLQNDDNIKQDEVRGLMCDLFLRRSLYVWTRNSDVNSPLYQESRVAHDHPESQRLLWEEDSRTKTNLK